MFDLEAQIEKWRAELFRTGIAGEVVDELEGHLREDVEKRTRLGLDDPQAFEAAVNKIGQARALRAEFRKLGIRSWNRRLTWAAWVMFVVSFFLPSYMDLPGWKCALFQPGLWDKAIHGHWPSINYELLTLANLLMLASPFLLFRYGGRPCVVRWFHWLNLIAVLLVWAFIGLCLTSESDRAALRIGCYVWGLSFVVLQVAAMRRPAQKKKFEFA